MSSLTWIPLLTPYSTGFTCSLPFYVSVFESHSRPLVRDVLPSLRSRFFFIRLAASPARPRLLPPPSCSLFHLVILVRATNFCPPLQTISSPFDNTASCVFRFPHDEYALRTGQLLADLAGLHQRHGTSVSIPCSVRPLSTNWSSVHLVDCIRMPNMFWGFMTLAMYVCVCVCVRTCACACACVCVCVRCASACERVQYQLWCATVLL